MYLVDTYLSLFQKHVGAQERISPASWALPNLSLLSWAHPPQPGLEQAGEAVLGPCQRICIQGFKYQGSASVGNRSLQGEGEAALVLGSVKSSPTLGAAHTPHTDVHQRLAVNQTVVQRIHQAHSILLQYHQHVLALLRMEFRIPQGQVNQE